MDADQQDRLAKLAARGRVSRTAPTSTPAPAARAAVPPPPAPAGGSLLPPPDPRLLIAAVSPVVVPIVERHPADVRAERRARRAAESPFGAMPAGIEPRPVRNGRKRHAAMAGRIVAAGMTTSAFLGGLAALASAPPPAWENKVAKTSADGTEGQAVDTTTPADTAPTTTEPPVQDTIYVVQKVPRVVYVDENGNPVETTVPAPVEEAPVEEAPPADEAAPVTAKPKAKAKAAAPAAGAPAPAPDAPAPAPAATAAPAPAATPAPTPAPTAAPKPKPAPTTVACTGSACP